MATAGEPSPPDFDFDNYVADQLPYYDPDRIAYEAVWPAVDEIWGGDWINEAKAGQELCFPSNGCYDHTELSVNLRAYCNLVERSRDGEESETSSIAAIEIEEKATGALRAIILNEAKKTAASLINSYHDEALTVTKSIIYTFDMDETAEIDVFQAIEDREGNTIWSSDHLYQTDEGAEDDQEYDEECHAPISDIDRFTQGDVDIISVALSILGAPGKCLEALKDIKDEPVLPQIEVEADE